MPLRILTDKESNCVDHLKGHVLVVPDERVEVEKHVKAERHVEVEGARAEVENHVERRVEAVVARHVKAGVVASQDVEVLAEVEAEANHGAVTSSAQVKKWQSVLVFLDCHLELVKEI